jgi:hypothetical protein
LLFLVFSLFLPGFTPFGRVVGGMEGALQIATSLYCFLIVVLVVDSIEDKYKVYTSYNDQQSTLSIKITSTIITTSPINTQ